MSKRTQDESGLHGHIHLENISGYQEKLRWRQAGISGTEAVRREILKISQLSASEPSALRAAASPEIPACLHLSSSTVSFELFSRCIWPCSPDSSCCSLACLKNQAELVRQSPDFVRMSDSSVETGTY